MGKVLAIVNQKGGVGKSTTAVNLVAGLTKRGYKVLGIDLDSQLCLTTNLQAKEDGATILSALLGEATLKSVTQRTPEADIVPASRKLVMADILLSEFSEKEYLLKRAMSPIRNKYDYVILDCSPALGTLTINALTATDSIIIPLKADLYSLDGVRYLMSTIMSVRQKTNPALTIEGLLFTQYEPRPVLSREVFQLASKFAESVGSKVFNTTIRRSITVAEAQANQKSLYSYAPQSKVTADYDNLITELTGEK